MRISDWSSDVCSSDLLASHWDDEKMDALLLLVPHARAHCHRGPGDFHMDDTGRITRRRTGRLAPFVFTGVQLISPRLLRDPPTDAFSTNVFWDRAIEEGRLYGVSHEGQIGRASGRERGWKTV